MINKIYANQPVNQTNFKHNVDNKLQSNYADFPNTNHNMQGMSALANYNKLFLNIDKDKLLETKVLSPIIDKRLDLNEVEGEKIYSSNGKLEAVIQENDREKIFYYPNNYDNKIETINLINKETGKITKKQSFCNGFDNRYFVENFNDAGEEIASSAYHNGRNTTNHKFVKNKFGEKINIGHSNEHNDYWLSTNTKDDSQGLRINFDYKKQINEIHEYKKLEHGEIKKTVHLNDGALVSINENKTTYIPNLTGTEKLKNPELVAHPKYNVIKDAAKFEGEKTFYSNGALETNTFETENGLVTYKFSPEGDIKNIKDGDLNIDFIENIANKSTQIIKENLGNNKYRETTYSNDDKLLTIEVQENDIAKTLYFDVYQDSIPEYYAEEKIIDKNTDERQTITALHLNKDGMVVEEY